MQLLFEGTGYQSESSHRRIVAQHHVHGEAGLQAFWFIHQPSLNTSHTNECRI